jgi:hypothetical protein
VDLWYAAGRRRISPVYLLDVIPELGFMLGWRGGQALRSPML